MSKKNNYKMPSVSPRIDAEQTVKAVTEYRKMTRKEQKAKYGKGSYIYNRYFKPIRDYDRQQKQILRSEWWWTKGLVILNTILALIAAITGIIALLQ